MSSHTIGNAVYHIYIVKAYWLTTVRNMIARLAVWMVLGAGQGYYILAIDLLVPYGCYVGIILKCVGMPINVFWYALHTTNENITLQLIAILENPLPWPGPGALLILAPPCSSWTRVSRGTTMRSRLNPLGLQYNFVLDGNLCISRFLVSKLSGCILLFHLTHILKIWYDLEFNHIILFITSRSLSLYLCSKHSNVWGGPIASSYPLSSIAQAGTHCHDRRGGILLLDPGAANGIGRLSALSS